MILGFSGSPIQEGNLDRMVQQTLELTREETKFYNLSQLEIRPCRGCLRCVPTNRCVQQDDMNRLLEEIEAAQGVILGTVAYFNHPNAFTRNFMERMYPLRHLKMLTAGKAGAAIALGAGPGAGICAAELEEYLGHFMCFKVAGAVAWQTGNPPCFVCGYGAECAYGLPAMMAGGLDKVKDLRIEFHRYEESPETVSALKALAGKMGELIQGGTK